MRKEPFADARWDNVDGEYYTACANAECGFEMQTWEGRSGFEHALYMRVDAGTQNEIAEVPVCEIGGTL